MATTAVRIPILTSDGHPLLDVLPAIPTVYGILVRHGLTGAVGLGYVGKTVQRLRARIEQHQAEQPFGDVIVLAFVIEQSAGWDDVRLSKRETYHIRAQRPWHNIVDNMDNRDRIPPWDAIAQRQAREPGWTPAAKVPRQRIPGGYGVAPVPRSALARWWARRRWPVIGVSALWLALFAGCCWLAAPVLDVGSTAVAGVTGATAPFVLVQLEIWRRRVRAWWRRKTRPKRRRRRR